MGSSKRDILKSLESGVFIWPFQKLKIKHIGSKLRVSGSALRICFLSFLSSCFHSFILKDEIPLPFPALVFPTSLMSITCSLLALHSADLCSPVSPLVTLYYRSTSFVLLSGHHCCCLEFCYLFCLPACHLDSRCLKAFFLINH